MNYKKISISITIFIIALAFSYFEGYNSARSEIIANLSSEKGWKNLSDNEQHNISQQAIPYVNWKNMTVDQARVVLTSVLDASKVPHGDLSVPSNTVMSKRYVISQWQRAAVTSIITILGTDADGDLSVALGVERNTLRLPQGYMETPLPKEDLTGLKKLNSSRLNSKTNEPVPADSSIEDNAIREVFEEIGLNITKSDLNLIGIETLTETGPITLAVQYYVMLHSTPSLETKDDEFASDDLQTPRWYKLKQIKYDPTKKQFFAKGNPFPLEDKTLEILNNALNTIGQPILQ